MKFKERKKKERERKVEREKNNYVTTKNKR